MNYNFWYKPFAIICLLWVLIPFFWGAVGVIIPISLELEEWFLNFFSGIPFIIFLISAPLAIIFYCKREQKK